MKNQGLLYSLINMFKFQDQVLETVNSYCHLGITITYTGGIVGSSNLLMEKDSKAFFKIKKISLIECLM